MPSSRSVALCAAFVACANAATQTRAATPTRTPTPSPSAFSFGARVSPVTGSSTWGVAYHGDYKVLNVTAAGATSLYVLTQAGHAAPTAPLGVPASLGATFITVPVGRAALLSSTQIAWAELLGVRSSIVAVAGASYISSPCVQQMIGAGAVLDTISSLDGYSTNFTALDLAAPDVVFCTPGYCPGTPLDVAFPDADETTLMGIADMAAFMSTFYNAEAGAASTVSTIATRLACTSATVAAARKQLAAAAVRGALPSPAPPATLWAYNYGGADGWYLATCPSYQCDAVAAAGGALISPAAVPAGAWGAYTDAQMMTIASGAAVWLYASDNWDAEMAPALANASGSSVGAVLAAAPAVSGASPAVFDVTLRGINSWFEDRPSQPDLLVQDLASAIFPNAQSIAGAFKPGTSTVATHARHWWRNVFTEMPLAPVTTCQSLAAAAALSSDVCPTRGSPSPLPSRTPTATRSRTPSGTPSRSAAASKTASRSPVSPTSTASRSAAAATKSATRSHAKSKAA